MTTQEAIERFERELPGWWWSLGNCSISADASCGPDRAGPDASLLEQRVFDDGFHADLPQPATPAEALMDVLAQALAAKMQCISLKSGQDHCGESILSTVASLWEARAEVDRLREKYARLREAAYEIYWSANWTADQEVDHDAMWDELRDAGALEKKEP